MTSHPLFVPQPFFVSPFYADTSWVPCTWYAVPGNHHDRASALIASVTSGHRERGGSVVALIVRVATLGYDDADEARSRRLRGSEQSRSTVAVHGITVPLLRYFPLLHRQSARNA
jgi:hypothetical protein